MTAKEMFSQMDSEASFGIYSSLGFLAASAGSQLPPGVWGQLMCALANLKSVYDFLGVPADAEGWKQ